MGLSMCGHLMAKGLPDDDLQPHEVARAAAARQGRCVVRHAGGCRRALRHHLYDRRPAERRARGLSAERRHSRRRQAGRDHRRHDDDRAQPRARDLRGGEGQRACPRSTRRSRAATSARRNATLSIMVGGDKDAVERVMPLFQAMGKNIVHQGGAGKRAAHEDVQSDRAGRNDHRRLRKPALRLQGRPRPRHDAELDHQRRRAMLDSRQPRAEDGEAQFRSGILRRALRKGSRHRARRMQADGSGHAWPRRSSASSTSRSNHRATVVWDITRCCWLSNSSRISSD